VAVVLGLDSLQKGGHMLSRIIEKTPLWLSIVFIFAAIAFKDSDNFFPLTSHSDLKFQIAGESLEILTFVGISVLARQFSRQEIEVSESRSLAKAPQIFTGAIVASILFVSFWRDYFPGGTYKFEEAFRDVGYSLIAGVVIALFTSIPPSRLVKQEKEEERSAV
jgi:hypothetical protein